MVASVLIVGALVLILLPTIVRFIESVTNGKNTSEDESIIVETVNDVLGEGPVQPSSNLETPGEVIVNNLKSNLTLTPKPDDPIFGKDNIFSSISNVIFGKNKEEQLDPKPSTAAPKKLAPITSNEESPFDIQQGTVIEKESNKYNTVCII